MSLQSRMPGYSPYTPRYSSNDVRTPASQLVQRLHHRRRVPSLTLVVVSTYNLLQPRFAD